MKKYKTMLLTLGTIATIVTPIATVVSCGSSAAKAVDIQKLTEKDYTFANPNLDSSTTLEQATASNKLPAFATATESTDLPASSHVLADGSSMKDPTKVEFADVDATASWSELDWLKFYANLDEVSPSSISKQARWKQTVTKTQVKQTLDHNLKARSKIATDAGTKAFMMWDGTTHAWVAAQSAIEATPDGTSFVGDVKSVKVVKRAKGGVVQILAITGSKHSILIASEFQIRFLLRFFGHDTLGLNKDTFTKNNALDIAMGPVDVYKRDEGKDSYHVEVNAQPAKYNSGNIFMFDYVLGSTAGFMDALNVSPTGYPNGFSSLLSGYFAIYEDGDNLTFYGGGFGHGVGMNQWGASQLGYRGWTADQILKHYYHVTPTVDDALKTKPVTVGITTSDTQNAGANDVSFSEFKIKPVPATEKLSVGTQEFKAGEEVTLKVVGNNIVATGDKQTTSTLTGAATKLADHTVVDDTNAITVSNDGKMEVSTLTESKDWIKGEIDADGQRIAPKDAQGKAINVAPQYVGKLIPYVSSKTADHHVADSEIKDDKDRTFFSIANTLPMDDYVERVLPSEMPSTFGTNALAAQAIAARSYAEAEIESGVKNDYGVDVLDNTSSQVFNRLTTQPWEIINGESMNHIAAFLTSGKVLKAGTDNHILEAKYAAVGSGYSSAATDVWVKFA